MTPKQIPYRLKNYDYYTQHDMTAEQIVGYFVILEDSFFDIWLVTLQNFVLDSLFPSRLFLIMATF